MCLTLPPTPPPLPTDLQFGIEVESVVANVYAEQVKPKLPIVDPLLLSVRTHTHINLLANGVKNALAAGPFTSENVIGQVNRVFVEFEARNKAV